LETHDRAIEVAAAGITARMYLSYVLDRYWLKKAGGKLIFERIQSGSREEPSAFSQKAELPRGKRLLPPV
jgi:hypothetical protein